MPDHKCAACGKVFSRKSSLDRHMLIHTGEGVFMCSICGQFFTRSAQLTRHMRTHTGERSFSCPACRSSYACHRQLMWHIMQTHRAGGSIFSCNMCSMSFSNRTLLLLHMRGEHRSRQSSADSGSVQQNNTSGVPVTIHTHRTEHSSGFFATIVSTLNSHRGSAVVTTIQNITSPITTTAVSQPSGTFIVTDSDHEPGQDYDNK